MHEDRVTLSGHTKWHKGTPPLLLTVEVWHLNEYRKAHWNGEQWIDVHTGEVLSYIEYWCYAELLP